MSFLWMFREKPPVCNGCPIDSQGPWSQPLVPAQMGVLKSPRQVSLVPRVPGTCFPQGRLREKDQPSVPGSPVGGGKPTHPVPMGRGGGARASLRERKRAPSGSALPWTQTRFQSLLPAGPPATELSPCIRSSPATDFDPDFYLLPL